jgi:hypothetical protein
MVIVDISSKLRSSVFTMLESHSLGVLAYLLTSLLLLIRNKVQKFRVRNVKVTMVPNRSQCAEGWTRRMAVTSLSERTRHMIKDSHGASRG